LGLFTVGGIDGDKVGDWASCEESALERGRGWIGADANALRDIELVQAVPGHSVWLWGFHRSSG